MGKTLYYYQHPTRVGIILLAPKPNNRCSVMLNREELGEYPSLMEALTAVTEGHISTSDGVKLDELNIPADIGEWVKKDFAKIEYFNDD